MFLLLRAENNVNIHLSTIMSNTAEGDTIVKFFQLYEPPLCDKYYKKVFKEKAMW